MKDINSFRDSIDEKLIGHLPVADSKHHEQVVEAMRYSFCIGGKRIRPMLMYGAFLMVSGDDVAYKSLEVFMASMEMIHTYSLIHDDLPAMDDDDLRRGKPTCHKKYGEAVAVLAGDGLLNYAFESAVKSVSSAVDAGELVLSKSLIKSLEVLTTNAGIYGMIGGQAADMKFETGAMESKSDLDYVYDNKTGALIRGSLVIGGLIGGGNVTEIEKLERIGRNIGLSFQIQDDLLDKYSTEEVLGKPIGSDEKNNKKTYISFVGEDQSRIDIRDLLDEAKVLASEFNGDTGLMLDVIEFLTERKY